MKSDEGDTMPTANVWAKLDRLCSVIHRSLYVAGQEEAARSRLREVESLVRQLPADDGSIVGAEARAICYQMQGDYARALAWRKREIDRMKSLYQDIMENQYDTATTKALLARRDFEALNERKTIVAGLLRSRKEARLPQGRKPGNLHRNLRKSPATLGTRGHPRLSSHKRTKAST